ncbi:MAG: formylglycine-generating enzyme family protein [Deltaproteobacteria bacterium]|nr:formylglycine-generating enzyme family protein [Deltaproteobacteria bacterium]
MFKNISFPPLPLAFLAVLPLALALAWTPSGSARAADWVNSLGMEFVFIPAGSFIMGSDPDAGPSWADERPARMVEITTPFYLGKYPVTQKEWKAVMGGNPSFFQGDDRPVEMVSWNDANSFIDKLNQREKTHGYRLPTEAEWEFSARAGSTTVYFFGDSQTRLSQYAWHSDNSDEETHPVGEKAPNPWGLYDILGNVWEWTGDWYDEDYYQKGPSRDPQGPASGSNRVRRGCSWDFSNLCVSANRSNVTPQKRQKDHGFRLLFTGSPPPRPQMARRFRFWESGDGS